MQSLAGVAFVFLLGVVPLLLPVAALSPNFWFVKQVTLRFSYDGAGVNCEEQSLNLLGYAKDKRYGPIEAASNDFPAVVNVQSEPGRDDVISILCLRSLQGSHYPFEGLNSSPQPRSMKVESFDVAAMSREINRYIQHPSREPLVLVRSQPYPVGFVIFDVIGLALGAVIMYWWTAPLCLAGSRKLSGAPAKEVSEPFLRLLSRLSRFAAWVKKS